MNIKFEIPKHRTEGAEVQDMNLPELYDLELKRACGDVILVDFGRLPIALPDEENYGWIYAVGGKGGVVQYIGMSAKKIISERINSKTIAKYRWASDNYYYTNDVAEFKLAVWAVPFNNSRDLEGIEIDVAAFYRVLVGAWPVNQIDISATSVHTVDSSIETWRYARAIIEDMNQYLKVKGNPFLPFIDDVADKSMLNAIAERSKTIHARSFTRSQLCSLVGDA